MATYKGELGRIGQKRYSGIFYEEFVRELAGANGVEVYREMSENDEVIGAILFAIEMLIRQCEFSVDPADKNNSADVEAAAFIENCLDDMEDAWQDVLSEILSFLTFGWSFHEIVYKRRSGGKTSKYDDGLIGWKKLPIRAQETLYQWKYKDNSDELEAMIQVAAPDFNRCEIPLEKALLFKTRNRKGNPEGRSVLRNAYRSWYFKKRIQEIEGIGIERDLAGLPVLSPPQDVDIWNTDDSDNIAKLAYAETIVQNIRRDELEGVVLPHEWELTLLTSGGRRNFDTSAIIDRYDKRIATTVLADFIFMGQGNVGSFALSSDKTRLFSLAVGTYLDIITSVFNKQAIPRLMDLNRDKFTGISDYPVMTHGDIEDANIAKFSAYIKDMVGAGVIVPDENLEQFARNLGNIPQTEERHEYTGANGQENEGSVSRRRADIEISDEPDEETNDTADSIQAEEAKKSLGRKKRKRWW